MYTFPTPPMLRSTLCVTPEMMAVPAPVFVSDTVLMLPCSKKEPALHQGRPLLNCSRFGLRERRG